MYHSTLGLRVIKKKKKKKKTKGQAKWWGVSFIRCRANMEHIRQSRPDSGLGFQVKVRKTFQVVPSSLGSGLKSDMIRFLHG